MRIRTPEAWTHDLTNREVDVLPLVPGQSQNWRAGWCTYSEDFDQFPEIETFAGGINTKTPTAAGLWRQGHLFHFGFEQSPAEMNDTGRALLLNAIAYISRFTEDRPLAFTPSVFAGAVARPRYYVARVIEREDRELSELSSYLAASVLAQVKTNSRAACRDWFADHGSYLHPAPSTMGANAREEIKLVLDEEARTLGTPPNQPAFFGKIIPLLRGSREDSERARRLLSRYAPEAPVDREPDVVEAWWNENKPYVFFSDAGGYRWYLDGLAKKRGVPSAELRGSKRATMAPDAAR